jgi:MFS family permease
MSQADQHPYDPRTTITTRRREPKRTRHDHEPVVQAFRDGLAYAWRQRVNASTRQRVVRAFALSEATFLFFRSAMMSVLLVFLARTLGVTPAVIGLIFTLGTIGGILGAAVARRIGRRLTPGRTILAANIARSIGIASIPLAVIAGPAAIPVFMTALLVASFGWTIWDVHSETVQQQLLAAEGGAYRKPASSPAACTTSSRPSNGLSGFATSATATSRCGWVRSVSP